MTNFTLDRRSLLKGGALTLATAATMSAEELLGYAKAWAQTAPWKPEAGAKINLLRWKRFVEAEDVAFMKIVDAFQKGGLSEVAQSWVSSGQNLPVSPEQIQSVLGSGVVGQFAEKLGVDPQTAAAKLSEILPGLVDKLTPGGKLPDEGLGGAVGDLLGGFLKS